MPFKTIAFLYLACYTCRRYGKRTSKGIYRHFKGNDYEVLHLAKDSETLETLVVYKALYGAGEIWVRPLKMFTETVEKDGKSQPRFRYLGEKQ